VYGLYGFLSSLLISGKMQFAPGRIDLLGDRLTMLSMNAVKQMTEDAEKRGIDGIQDMYFEGWVFGYEFTYKLIENLNLKRFEETYKVVMDVTGLIGFGDYKTLEFKRGFAKFQVLKNPLAEICKPADHPIDHLLRGMNAGGGTVVHGEIINDVELECLAQNRPHCIFINANEKYMHENGGDPFVASQLGDTDKLKQRQIEFIRKIGHDPEVYLHGAEGDYLPVAMRKALEKRAQGGETPASAGTRPTA